MTKKVFKNRREAGRLLAQVVAQRQFPDPVIIALPRGGVPVAIEVANMLKAPLDLVLVRKLGAPMQPELAVGAVVDGASQEIVLNDEIVDETGTSEDYIRSETARQLGIIEERRKLWIEGRDQVPVTGKTAIVVDDGIATGATIRAALHALRRQSPRRLVVATPIAAPETCRALRADADEIITIVEPRKLGAIGLYYRDFSQVGDGEVTAMLQEFDKQSGVRSAPAGPK